MTPISILNNAIKASATCSCGQLRQCFMDLERYANDGSPSKFNNGVAFEYHPFNNKKSFDLPVYLSKRLDHVQVGQLPSFWTEDFSCENKLPIPVHPEVLKIVLSSCPSLASENFINIKVEPTSSGRTVLWEGDKDYAVYIKLHFPKILGRFSRDLSIYKWLSCLEKSKEFYIHSKSFPPYMSFLYDFGGVYYLDSKTKAGFGTIFREFIPRPRISQNYHLLFPAFSLISKSYKKYYKNILFHLLLDLIGTDESVFLSLFVEPLIRSYLFLCLTIGLIPECNAQNILYEINTQEIKTRIVYRDLGDTFVDHEVREMNNLHNMFCTYKSLDGVFDKDIFQRRSFAYDFKLSYYIIKPLIDRYAELTRKSKKCLYNDVKDIFHSNFSYSKSYFESDDYWYSYPNKRNVGRENYIMNSDPIFR